MKGPAKPGPSSMVLSMLRRPSLIIFANLLVAGLTWPAAAQEEPSFVAQPAPGARTDPGKAFFLLEVEPGTRLSQRVGLRNDGDQRLTLDLAAVDGETAESGGVSYNLAAEPVEGPGGWISLERESVTVGPGESLTVPFRVAIPKDAVSGIHLGGISVEPADAEGPEPTGQAQIVITTRRVVPVVFDLPGPQDPELVIHGVEPDARPDGVYLEIEIENVGTDATEGEGLVVVDDAGFEEEFIVGRFVPHTSIRYPVKWAATAADGEYCASVELTYEVGNGSKTAAWDGCFAVGERIQEQLEDRGAPGNQSFFEKWRNVILAVVGILLLLAVLWFFLIWRRRRRDDEDQGRKVPETARRPAISGAAQPAAQPPRRDPNSRPPPPPPTAS